MNGQRYLGIALAVIGVVLLVIGMNASDSVADSLSKTFTDKYTDSTMWYLVGGGALTLVGLALAFIGFGKKAT